MKAAGVRQDFLRCVQRIYAVPFHLDARQIELGPASRVGVDTREPRMQGIDGFLQLRHLARRSDGIHTLNFGSDPMDRLLELLHALLFAGEK